MLNNQLAYSVAIASLLFASSAGANEADLSTDKNFCQFPEVKNKTERLRQERSCIGLQSKTLSERKVVLEQQLADADAERKVLDKRAENRKLEAQLDAPLLQQQLQNPLGNNTPAYASTSAAIDPATLNELPRLWAIESTDMSQDTTVWVATLIPAYGQPYKVQKGETLQSGWTIKYIGAEGVVVERNGQETALRSRAVEADEGRSR